MPVVTSTTLLYGALAATVLASGAQAVVSSKNASKSRKQTQRGQQKSEDRAHAQETKNAMATRRADRRATNNDIGAILASNKPKGNTPTDITRGTATTTLGGGMT